MQSSAKRYVQLKTVLAEIVGNACLTGIDATATDYDKELMCVLVPHIEVQPTRQDLWTAKSRSEESISTARNITCCILSKQTRELQQGNLLQWPDQMNHSSKLGARVSLWLLFDHSGTLPAPQQFLGDLFQVKAPQIRL